MKELLPAALQAGDWPAEKDAIPCSMCSLLSSRFAL